MSKDLEENSQEIQAKVQSRFETKFGANMNKQRRDSLEKEAFVCAVYCGFVSGANSKIFQERVIDELADLYTKNQHSIGSKETESFNNWLKDTTPIYEASEKQGEKNASPLHKVSEGNKPSSVEDKNRALEKQENGAKKTENGTDSIKKDVPPSRSSKKNNPSIKLAQNMGKSLKKAPGAGVRAASQAVRSAVKGKDKGTTERSR